MTKSIGLITAAAALLATFTTAPAADDGKYPNLKGQWNTLSPRGSFDPDKPPGRVTLAPLTDEYKAVYDWNVKDQLLGGHGTEPSFTCLPPGMPRIMHAYAPMEVVVTPETTYILMEHIHDNRRIHTDGRDFPENMDDDPMYAGYSIGKWVDQDGDGRYDALLVETRGLKGPRNYDVSGIPLHRDNQSIIRERIYLDKANPNLLHDEITTIDHALTRPACRTFSPDPSTDSTYEVIARSLNLAPMSVALSCYEKSNFSGAFSITLTKWLIVPEFLPPALPSECTGLKSRRLSI